LVLDNNSTDDTVQWIESLHDARVVIYRSPESLGMEANWERAIAVKKNEFMTLIGHDDILHSDYLSAMNALIEKHPTASLYQSHFKFIDANGNDVRPCMPMKEIQYADEFLKGEMTRTMDSMGTGYMMRSSDYDALGGISPLYPNLIFADYELWVKLTNLGYLAVSGEEAFSYRLHDSASKLTNGEEYQRAFGRYVLFLTGIKEQNQNIKAVIDQYGKRFLLYFCQSLSHRLLKTSASARKTSVGAFIKKCRGYAQLLIPDQSFRPLAKPKILAAYLLDNAVGLKLFRLYKKLQGK
jgi:glycosyltransferase involved in cell wall biosynthesis